MKRDRPLGVDPVFLCLDQICAESVLPDRLTETHDFLHHGVKGGGRKGLLSVAFRMCRIIVDFDHQTVCTGCHGGERK